MVRFEDIVEMVTTYNPRADIELLKKAYLYSGMVHKGQTRLSGEPYLVHPLQVAHILAELKMDTQSIVTGLLHDTVEDTHTTIEKIEETFGPEIASLVDGVTKISRIKFENREDQEAENYRKMILAMSRDIRVILIKLADRLHNMRTLAHHSGEKQQRIAEETLTIYAPLANRLGIGWIKTELEDLSFRFMEPERYQWLNDKVFKERETWNKYTGNARAIIEETLTEHAINAEVTGRFKHLYSIERKMKLQDLEFEDIHDIIALRVIVMDVKECYASLGVIHSIWKPVPGNFKDYIALPKLNLYQSLHTIVIGPYGVRMEIQIRTKEMHRVAEYGIASHWKYKEGGGTGEDDYKDYKRFAWLRQLLEWQRDLKDTDEFMDSLKVGLYPDEVFIFTPKGEVKQLPTGATPVDFAYAIHTDIGDHCSGAKVNGQMTALKTRLHNGDVVNILTSRARHPSADWLNYVVTSKARTKIRHWIKTEERARGISMGRDICEREFSRRSLDLEALIASGVLESLAKDAYSLPGLENLFACVGYGKIQVTDIMGRIMPEKKSVMGHFHKFSIKDVLGRIRGGRKIHGSPVLVSGGEDLLITFADCCSPLPGDRIVGYITHGHGISVHLARCPNLLNVDKERMVDVAWDKDSEITRSVKIMVVCKNEKGMLAVLTGNIHDSDANISNAEIRTIPDNRSLCTFEVEVRDIKHLKTIIDSLSKIKKVQKVRRVKGKVPFSYESAFASEAPSNEV
ncbi:MAG: RelA/SpoT family protein [Thermodesulfobacteriota bacterium]